MTTELHRVLPGFAHDDAFLDLVTGAHAAFARFDEVLAKYAPDNVKGDAEPCDELVLPLLGLIALRERVARALADAPAPRAQPLPRPTEHESLLR